MAADTGGGATLTQASLTLAITSIDVGGKTLPLVDTTLLADTIEKMIGGDTIQQKPITVGFRFDPTDSDNVPTLNGNSVATTVTFPGQGGTAATLIGTVINSDYTLPNLQVNTAQDGTLVMTPDGQTEMAFTVES